MQLPALYVSDSVQYRRWPRILEEVDWNLADLSRDRFVDSKTHEELSEAVVLAHRSDLPVVLGKIASRLERSRLAVVVFSGEGCGEDWESPCPEWMYGLKTPVGHVDPGLGERLAEFLAKWPEDGPEAFGLLELRETTGDVEGMDQDLKKRQWADVVRLAHDVRKKEKAEWWVHFSAQYVQDQLADWMAELHEVKEDGDELLKDIREAVAAFDQLKQAVESLRRSWGRAAKNREAAIMVFHGSHQRFLESLDNMAGALSIRRRDETTEQIKPNEDRRKVADHLGTG